MGKEQIYPIPEGRKYTYQATEGEFALFMRLYNRAAKYLREVEDLEKQIMFAQDARVAPKSQPTKGVEAIQNKISKIDARLEGYRKELAEMPTKRRRTSINITYDSLLNDRQRLESLLANQTSPKAIQLSTKEIANKEKLPVRLSSMLKKSSEDTGLGKYNKYLSSSPNKIDELNKVATRPAQTERLVSLTPQNPASTVGAGHSDISSSSGREIITPSSVGSKRATSELVNQENGRRLSLGKNTRKTFFGPVGRTFSTFDSNKNIPNNILLSTNKINSPTKGVEASQKLKVQAPVQTEIIPKTQIDSSPLLRVQDKQSQIPQQQKITLKNQPLDNQNIELKNSIG